MQIHEEALHLAGFALAHAAWSVSDITDGKLLCPLAITECNSERNLLRFEAETQEQAIGDAINALEDEQSKVDAWTFVREGLISTDHGKFDVLVASVWAKGMVEPLYFNQLFIPLSKASQFHILGPLNLLNAPEEDSAEITVAIRKGLFDHHKDATLWPQWEINFSS